MAYLLETYPHGGTALKVFEEAVQILFHILCNNTVHDSTLYVDGSIASGHCGFDRYFGFVPINKYPPYSMQPSVLES